jgi:hypothetical protein
MAEGVISFLLRLGLILAVWMFVWNLGSPKTQRLGIFRAAILVIALMAVLALVRSISF